jgi:Nucleotidyl transferase AbiEii toxin, Type IV TA system
VPEYTRPATWDDLKRLAKLLNEVHAQYALVGGYAIASHGFSRQTEDIDLLVDPAADNSRRWIVALSQLPDRAVRALEQEPDVFADDKRYALRVNDEFTVDILPSVAGRSWDEMQQYVETIDLDGVPLRVLNLEGLLLSKQGDRPKDRRDAAILRQALDILKPTTT